MNNAEKYISAFTESFGMSAEAVKTLKYQDVPAWDSVGHMGLMAKIEEAFGIMMEPDDIIDFSSFEKGMEILATKYGVQF